MYCLFTGRLAYNWGGGVGANMRGAGGGGAISGRLWYVILVALEGIILIVIL